MFFAAINERGIMNVKSNVFFENTCLVFCMTTSSVICGSDSAFVRLAVNFISLPWLAVIFHADSVEDSVFIFQILYCTVVTTRG